MPGLLGLLRNKGVTTLLVTFIFVLVVFIFLLYNGSIFYLNASFLILIDLLNVLSIKVFFKEIIFFTLIILSFYVHGFLLLYFVPSFYFHRFVLLLFF